MCGGIYPANMARQSQPEGTGGQWNDCGRPPRPFTILMWQNFPSFWHVPPPHRSYKVKTHSLGMSILGFGVTRVPTGTGSTLCILAEQEEKQSLLGRKNCCGTPDLPTTAGLPSWEEPQGSLAFTNRQPADPPRGKIYRDQDTVIAYQERRKESPRDPAMAPNSPTLQDF